MDPDKRRRFSRFFMVDSGHTDAHGNPSSPQSKDDGLCQLDAKEKQKSQRPSLHKRLEEKKIYFEIGGTLILGIVGIFIGYQANRIAAGQKNLAEESSRLALALTRLQMPPVIDLDIEFPDPSDFPPNDAPLIKPPRELYLFRNRGGPCSRVNAEIVDMVEASAEPCGELDKSVKVRPPVHDPNHKARKIMNDDVEMAFFVPPKHWNFEHFFDDAVFGIEFNDSSPTVKRIDSQYQDYLGQYKNICGHINLLSRLVHFVYVDIQGVHHEKLYEIRFGKIREIDPSGWDECRSDIMGKDKPTRRSNGRKLTWVGVLERVITDPKVQEILGAR